MKITIITITILVSIAGTLALYAPHVVQLLREGYPRSIWPANGSFERVEGINDKTPLPQPTPIQTEWLRKLVKDSDTQALLIYRNGSSELSYYAPGYSPETRFNSFSAVKSLIGALMFRAVSERKISSLDDPVGNYVSGLRAELSSKSLRAFLDMRSGVLFKADGLKTASGQQEKDLEQTISNPFGPMAKLHVSGLRPLIPDLKADQTDKGEYSYQNINTAILGHVLENTYKTSLGELLSGKIWKPSGASTAYWRRYNKDEGVSAYCCLYARARDWVKVAHYIMRNGTQEAPFLSGKLWQEFMGQNYGRAEISKGHYANHVRYDVLDREGEPLQGMFRYFLGQGGQTVYLLPEHSFVVVRFGDRNPLLHSTLYAAWREAVE